MDIHIEKKTLTTNGGIGSENTLPIQGGICRQIYILANTSTTTFRFDVTNEDSLVIRSYDFHKGEINDDYHLFPVRGVYTLRIRDCVPDDTFKVAMVIEQ